LHLVAGLVYCIRLKINYDISGIARMFKFGNHIESKSFDSVISTLLTSAALMLPAFAMATNVMIETPLGDIEIELLEEDAPNTVANFLRYVDNDSYNLTFMHRSVPGFVIQGGGFAYDRETAKAVGISTFPTIENEFNVSNTRGTLAMAKGNDPDSADSQWFINLADNSAHLDNDTGGFTVFARVVGDGMQVADAIAGLSIVNAGGAANELPVIDFSGGALAEANLVMTDISRIDNFVMNAGLNDAWFNPVTSGQGFFVTVFPNLQSVSLSWFTFDTELPADDASANLGDPGHRWLTAIGPLDGNRSEMQVYITSGGLFDNGAAVENVEDGTIILTFDDCASGTVEYDIPSIDQQGSVPIQRVAADNQALCEALIVE